MAFVIVVEILSVVIKGEVGRISGFCQNMQVGMSGTDPPRVCMAGIMERLSTSRPHKRHSRMKFNRQAGGG